MKLKTKHIQLFEDFISDIGKSENERNRKTKKESTDLKADEIDEKEEIEEEDLVAEIKKYFKKNK
jgi:hypothetical protein